MICAWVQVEHNGIVYEVAPTYIAPIGIGEAIRVAADAGCILPTTGLVDAIWKAADMKLAPLPRKHNGTISQMAVDSIYVSQRARIDAQLAGRDYVLLAGTHKDVCVLNGNVGIYGWHKLDGRVIQPFFAGHAMAWKDYSQGLRLCRLLDGDVSSSRLVASE